MKKVNLVYVTLIMFFILYFTPSCQSDKKIQTKRKAPQISPFSILEPASDFCEISKGDLINGLQPLNSDKTVNVVIEIPASTNHKWETEKDGKTMSVELRDGKPRIVQFLGYPGNYGFVPRTAAGDNDPLDILVLGSMLPRGIVAKVKLIGVLMYKDRGEQDDKLLALHSSSPFYHSIEDVSALKKSFPAVIEILSTWFSNYKGPGKMKFEGLGNCQKAESVLKDAITNYSKSK